MYKHVQIPFYPGINKMRTQEVVHAVEELYFRCRFAQGIDLVNEAFQRGGAEAVDKDTQKLLEEYRRKCLLRLQTCTQSS